MNHKTAVYPGTFDPITNGHLDVIERGLKMFDKIAIGVAENKGKKALFSLEERVELARKATAQLKGIEVKPFSKLLVDFAKENKSRIILRGLRALSDFEFEFQAASMNRKLNPEIETVFIVTNEKYYYLSSSMVKEVASLGGKISDLVPKEVEAALKGKFG